ncbi:alpha/beta hydrolase family protein [Clostridium polynesiense]|uniref:alpha/beta hydrolase family protein n=1 Tax=Clostridium polynesiense TaxID=1325933 RepID=UPI00058B6593|nr:alpha/beta fold hydrolase [Clostridium polynesiense]
MLNNEYLNIEKIILSGIPCIVIKPREAEGKLKTILLYHGWSSKKENHTMLGETLALYGYMVIIPDAAYHGERGSIDYEDPNNAAKYFWNIVFNNIKESETLLCEAVRSLGGDEKNIGVIGHSMGGFSAAGIFIKHPEVKAIVNINGSFAYEKAENIFLTSLNSGFTVPKEHLEELKSYDPVNNKDKFKDRAVLMLHGEADAVVSIESQEYFYKEILNTYKAASENIKFVRYPRLNHYVTIAMVEEAIEWFNKHLV